MWRTEPLDEAAEDAMKMVKQAGTKGQRRFKN